MAKSSPILTQFNGGELSPLIAGRVDIAKYTGGCKRMENFLPTIQGPAITRPGTWFVQEVKDSTDRTWLLPFEFSAEDSYMLEFGDGYIRFYFNHAQVVVSGVAAYDNAHAYAVGDLASSAGVNYYCKAATTGNAPPNATYWYPLTGSIYEIPSPYSAADLTSSDGTRALKFAQTGDVIYLVHASHPPYKLSRYGATDWTLAAVEFGPPPFKTLNSGTVTIVSSAATGTGVTLTASASTFTSAHVGQYLYLGEKDVRDIEQWEAGKAVTAGDLRRSDGKNYQALNTATTGSVKPTHAEGAAFDGDGAVQWQFLDAGYGWVKITAYTDPTHVTADVVSRLPDGAVGTNLTTRWAFQAWNSTDGYPEVVSFFRERLTFARDSTLWFSVSADFENFAYQIDGQTTADAGFDRTLSSDRVNDIRWLSPKDVLLVGTLGDEWAIVEATTSDPFGPSNCKTKRQSRYGSNRVPPVAIGADTLFVQTSGRKVRAMASQFSEDELQSPDITAFANHIPKPGIVDMAFQQEPWSVVWGARSDGMLVACTFSREQNVVAWHRHPFADGIVECVSAIPAPDGTRDDLWAIVRYTISGSTKRYIAYLATEDDETGSVAQADWAYSDMMLKYEGVAADTISGLDHLEGETVWVLANGGSHPDCVVSGGAITLQRNYTPVVIGKPCEAIIETMSLEGGSASGTAQGKVKRAHLVHVRVNRSLGGSAGPDEDHLKALQFRSPSTPMGSPPPPFTGDVDVEWDADYGQQCTLVVKKDRPMPITLIALMPELVGSEGR